MKQFSIKGAKSEQLSGKKITLCVTGSVACTRTPELARELIRHGADVTAVMSSSAQKLIGPQLLQWACENDVVTELTGRIEHVRLGAYSDLVIVFPSTANTISKIACGIDDTPVTSTVSCALGAGIHVILVPAMHLSMYEHKAIRENLKKLGKMGVEIVEPRIDEGKAKIAWNEDVVERAISCLTPDDLAGKKLVITGGPTYEQIDSCRGIINRSSGKMACALASRAVARGAKVTLVYGPGRENPPVNVNIIPVTSAEEMVEKTLKSFSNADCLISVAAIADYSPKKVVKGKFEGMDGIKLKKNRKLVSLAKKKHPHKLVVGFKLEEKLDEKKALKCVEKGPLDLVVANSVKSINADEAEVVITDGKKRIKLKAGKAEIAEALLNEVREKLKRQKR